jgi:hypothetical protein
MEGVSPLILDWLSHRYKFKYVHLEKNIYNNDLVYFEIECVQLYISGPNYKNSFSMSNKMSLYSYSILDINAPPRPLQTLEARGPNNPGIISYAVGGVRK